MKTALAVGFCFGLPFLAAFSGAALSTDAPRLYATLDKPSWAPPASLFGPVWTALYLMMGIAAFLVWRRAGWSALLGLFAIHLLFNAAWNPIFFGMKNAALALADIAVLWGMIAALTIGFFRIQAAAGALLIPYWAWVSFAAALNYSLWVRNPQM